MINQIVYNIQTNNTIIGIYNYKELFIVQKEEDLEVMPRAFLASETERMKDLASTVSTALGGTVLGIDIFSVITTAAAIKDDGIMISFS